MSFFAVLIDWLSSFWDSLVASFLWLLDAVLVLLQFVFFTILDGFLSVIETMVSAIDFSAVLFNYAASWSALPSQLIYLINAVGLPQCFAMLGGAYAIRLTLNLIPSWATRV